MTGCMADGINTFNENPLHKALKEWCGGPEAEFEVPLEGYIIDAIVDGVLIEVQTRNFGKMRRKLTKLVESHPVRLVHPVSFEKWIVRENLDGEQLSRRKSPKRGRLEDVFSELVAFPQLMSERNFSLETVLIQEEELRIVDGKKRRWGRDFKRDERRMLSVVDSKLFMQPRDMANLIPESLEEPFTTSDIAKACGMRRFLAQKMAYCLREMGAIIPLERKKSGIQYIRSTENAEGIKIGKSDVYEPIGLAS
jgi:hypothetical protein